MNIQIFMKVGVFLLTDSLIKRGKTMRSQILPIKRMNAEMDPARKMLSSIFVRS